MLWILLPMTGLLLRALGGDGWQDAGIQPHLLAGCAGTSWLWCSFRSSRCSSFFLASASFSGRSLFRQPPRAGAPFVGPWRLASPPRLSRIFWKSSPGAATSRRVSPATTANPWIIHLLTGLIWAGWHIPYLGPLCRCQPVHGAPLARLYGRWAFTLVITAVTYGELRLLSNSVWPGHPPQRCECGHSRPGAPWIAAIERRGGHTSFAGK